MSIKKSRLEQKLFYRILRVFVLGLPLLVAVVIIWRGDINVADLSLKNILDIAENNIEHFAYFAIGVVLYFVIVSIVWRALLYIIFGGLEDDTKQISNKKIPLVVASAGSALTPADKNQIIGWVLMLIVIACIYYAYFIYKSPQPIHILEDEKKPACISTGCGNLWRCTGTYYVSESQKRVDSCFSSAARPSILYSSWSGACRQCP
ncbi:MAG: hypothetical protein V1821_00405 [bacterium]